MFVSEYFVMFFFYRHALCQTQFIMNGLQAQLV